MKNLLITSGAVILSLLVVQFISPSLVSAGTSNCSQYAYKQCVSNISYWYDSCGNIQEVAQNCNSTKQICSNSQCVNGPDYNVPQTYIQNYRTACYNSNIYWYNSNGGVQGIYQNCTDNNSCTVDICGDNKCSNTIKCDGSTCAINSTDYLTYCAKQAETNTQITSSNFQSPSGSLIISVFGKKESDTMQWSKFIDAANNDKLNFVIAIKNISNSPVDNASVSVDLTGTINYTGNLKIDNISSAGNVASGINLGTLAPNTSRAVSFTGTVQSSTVQAIRVSVKIASDNMADADFLTINIPVTSSSLTAAVSVNPFVDFVKKWYLWAIIIIVLIILFVIIFRRLSTNV